ncbi:hypothetical protein GDO86_020641 [Hymenochirus boettgeri]|uniref:Macroglobulin domain-containing protein n=1 Tax=Hymenochirus boettgeri TaxID=247094 RepID=A0A8T2IH73_9PIPI|nr:hypothetical protein GDO86_020641 [Hymenochirus boettgeri]
MILRALCAGMIVLHLSGTLEAELHYAAIFPSEMHCHHPEQVCVDLDGTEGDRIQLTLKMANSKTSVIDKTLQEKSLFSCITFQVPSPSEDEEVAMMEVTVHSAGETITNSSKVFVKRGKTKTFIQTDKAVYKPGQTVKFRVVSIKEDLHPGENQFPVIELQDPGKNRIGQWLNVSLKQGIAELSLPLSKEPALGEYSIHTVLRYNVPPPKSDATFSIRVKTTPEDCPQGSLTKFQIDISVE